MLKQLRKFVIDLFIIFILFYYFINLDNNITIILELLELSTIPLHSFCILLFSSRFLSSTTRSNLIQFFFSFHTIFCVSFLKRVRYLKIFKKFFHEFEINK